MNGIPDGPLCSTGIQARERIAGITVSVERLKQDVEILSRDIQRQRERAAWRDGLLAAIGALVGGSLGNLIQLWR